MDITLLLYEIEHLLIKARAESLLLCERKSFAVISN